MVNNGWPKEHDSRMPIYRLIKDTAFAPEEAAILAKVFEDVCRTLGLEPTDPRRELVAKKIIECAQSEVRDRGKLRESAFAALKEQP